MARCQCRFLENGHGESLSLLFRPRDTFCTDLQGSSVQLPSYGWAKGLLVEQGWAADGFATFLSASAVSGVAVVSGNILVLAVDVD